MIVINNRRVIEKMFKKFLIIAEFQFKMKKILKHLYEH